MFDNYGFWNGLLRRIFQKIIPTVVPAGSFEALLIESKEDRQLDMEKESTRLSQAFKSLDKESKDSIIKELDQAIMAMASKIVSFGLDKHLRNKFELLQLDATVFNRLLLELSSEHPDKYANMKARILEIQSLFESIRRRKSQIGTSIHLTYRTKIILDYLSRLKKLISLRSDPCSSDMWKILIDRYYSDYRKVRSLRFYVKSHIDLVFRQIVEHTSNRGEKYIAENRKELFKFLKMSMIAGLIIACFALGKILLDHSVEGVWGQAFFFSMNYALCFILVKEFHGVIATKQPAMTASTIARHIDQNNDYRVDNLSSVGLLIRNVFKTQSVSFIGNVGIALPAALLLGWIMGLLDNSAFAYPYLSDKLLADIAPDNMTNLYYAAIAGLFLSFSGLISGYIDNFIVYSEISKRIRHHRTLTKILPERWVRWLAYKVSKHLGATLGNIALGVFLGSAFLLQDLMGIPFDIRHIAFSASYLGFAMSSTMIPIDIILFGLLGVALIGLINFVVSFLLTSVIAFKSRGLTLVGLIRLMSTASKEARIIPLSFKSYTNAQNDIKSW